MALVNGTSALVMINCNINGWLVAGHIPCPSLTCPAPNHLIMWPPVKIRNLNVMSLSAHMRSGALPVMQTRQAGSLPFQPPGGRMDRTWSCQPLARWTPLRVAELAPRWKTTKPSASEKRKYERRSMLELSQRFLEHPKLSMWSAAARPPMTNEEKELVQRSKFAIIPASDIVPGARSTLITIALDALEEHICREILRTSGSVQGWSIPELTKDPELRDELMDFLGRAAFSPTEGLCMIEHLQRLHFAEPTPGRASLSWAVFRASVAEPGDGARQMKAKDYLKVLMNHFDMIGLKADTIWPW
jgi:hypothetical protein